MSNTEKLPQRQKKVSVVLPLSKLINDSTNSIGVFSVTSTDNSVLSVVIGSLMEKKHISGFLTVTCSGLVC